MNETKTTIIAQPALRLITAKADSFPDGGRAAFLSLESQLETLRGRKFYGLVYETESGMDYFAGLIPEDAAEERRFSELGFSITQIDGGACARVKLLDWNNKLDQIGSTFGAMIGEYGIDSSRPQMEFYRSLNELHLLLPVPPQSRSDSREE